MTDEYSTRYYKTVQIRPILGLLLEASLLLSLQFIEMKESFACNSYFDREDCYSLLFHKETTNDLGQLNVNFTLLLRLTKSGMLRLPFSMFQSNRKYMQHCKELILSRMLFLCPFIT